MQCSKYEQMSSIHPSMLYTHLSCAYSCLSQWSHTQSFTAMGRFRGSNSHNPHVSGLWDGHAKYTQKGPGWVQTQDLFAIRSLTPLSLTLTLHALRNLSVMMERHDVGKLYVLHTLGPSLPLFSV